MKISDVMDLKEASEKYNINIWTLKSICQKGSHDLILEKDYRKSGRSWLITKETMEHLSKVVKKRNS